MLRRHVVVVCVLVVSALAPGERLFGQSSGPDIIGGDLWGTVANWGKVGNITGYSIGATACNMGDAEVSWVATNNQHPVQGTQLYRLKDGRFEQIGMAWAMHEFLALAYDDCGFGCVPPIPYTGLTLGVGCSHPDNASITGKQTKLGPRGHVNAFTGYFPYPFTQVPYPPPGYYEVHTGRRLQVSDDDLDPGLNELPRYFAEIQYIAADDSAARNNFNNVSYREVLVDNKGGGVYDLILIDTTVRQTPAIHAWQTADPTVQETTIQIPDEGRFILAAQTTDLGGGIWHYEYALYNMNSDRSGQSFFVPIPAEATVTNIGFHDIDYHSGDSDPLTAGTIRGTDWTATRTADGLTWQTDVWDAADRQANALRWGTVYNFRFDADRPSTSGSIRLGLYKPGVPASIWATTVVPRIDPPCFTNAECEDGNPCTTDICSDWTCGHTPIPGCCLVNSDCDDGLYCSGEETCGSDHTCLAGTPVNCGSHKTCDEGTDSCVYAVDWGMLAVQLEEAACCMQPGDTFTVLLTAANLQEAINGVQACIRFDQNLLTVQSITPGDGAGSPWDNALEVYENTSNGYVTYAVILVLAGTQADAVVAQITFTASASDPAGSAASVEVLPELPPLVTELTLAATAVAIIPSRGAPLWTGPIIARGDMNGDGGHNGSDVQGFVDAFLAGDQRTPAQLCAADMDCDCALTEYDLQLFVNCLLTGQCACP